MGAYKFDVKNNLSVAGAPDDLDMGPSHLVHPLICTTEVQCQNDSIIRDSVQCPYRG